MVDGECYRVSTEGDLNARAAHVQIKALLSGEALNGTVQPESRVSNTEKY
jgi:hypothetical protein